MKARSSTLVRTINVLGVGLFATELASHLLAPADLLSCRPPYQMAQRCDTPVR